MKNRISIPNELYTSALRLILEHQIASPPFFRCRLFLSWSVADGLMRRLEETGVVGPHAGAKLRKIDMQRLRQELEETTDPWQ